MSAKANPKKRIKKKQIKKSEPITNQHRLIIALILLGMTILSIVSWWQGDLSDKFDEMIAGEEVVWEQRNK